MVALGPRARRLVATGVVLTVVTLWWWWPGLAGDPDDVDVRLAIGDELSVADQSIDRRLREEGFLIERTRRPADWCDVAAALDEAPDDGSRVVVWAGSLGDCTVSDAVDDVLDAAHGRRVVVVRLPIDDDAVHSEFAARGATVVDTERLVGEPGASFECLWWEDCPSSGVVEPWDGDALGTIGGERVARLIVTAVS